MTTWLMIACSGQQPKDPEHTGATDSLPFTGPRHSALVEHTGGDSAHTGDTGGGAHTGEPPVSQCDSLPLLPILPVEVLRFPASGYFGGDQYDFDANGYFVYDQFGSLAMEDGLGLEVDDLALLAYYSRVLGMRTQSNGRLAYYDETRGQVREVELSVPPRPGTTQDLLVASGRGYDGLEVGPADALFLSNTTDGEIVRLEPSSGTLDLVAAARWAFHLAWSEELQQLWYGDEDGVKVVDYDAVADTFAPPRLIFATNNVQGVAVDVCGNGYAITQTLPAELIRFNPRNGQADVLATMPSGGPLRWGSDRGVFRRDLLYMTFSWGRLYSMDVGNPGGAQPVDRAP